MTQLPEFPTNPSLKTQSVIIRRPLDHHNPYQHLVDHFPDILYRYRVQPPVGFEFINPAIAGMTGHPPEDFLKNPTLLFKQVHPEDRHLLEDCLGRVSCTAAVEMRFIDKDGKLVWAEHRSIPVIDAGGNVTAVEGIVRDITLLKQARTGEIDQKYAMVSHLISLGKALNKPSSLYELAEIIGIAVKHLSHADAAILIKLSPNNQVLCLWSSGLEDERVRITAQQVYLSLKDAPLNEENLLIIKDPQDEAARFKSMIISPLVYEHGLLGGLACYSIRPHAWSNQNLEPIEAFSRQAAIAIQNIQLSRELQESYLQAILALTKTMKFRDVYTADHSHEVVGWAEALAWKLGCRTRDIESIRWAALLHDIGKIGVPDFVLGKPTRLNDEEWKVMKRHSQIGADIVGVIQQMSRVSHLIKYHHEHYDGTGYPDGLTGDQIPLGARILAVVDAYSAMTANRIYRPARAPREARDELERTSGSQFDPKVVNVFLQILSANTNFDQVQANA
jgi:putative nucleotidyltransferase with HDIG domain/PAS domain S-box-containing protein